MGCFSDDVKKVFKDWKQDKLLEELEVDHAQLVTRRVTEVEYGDPSGLSPKKRTILNSKVLRQALLHRADCLIVGTGAMLLAKNVYGMALAARGHLETTAVLAFFCNRVDTFSKGNIDFQRFESDVADAVMGAHHELFTQANKPQNISACIEKGDKFLNTHVFGKKQDLLADCYAWLSEFAHPNYCSNKTAFQLDKKKNAMIFRHEGDLQESDFQLIGYLELSAKIFPDLFDKFGSETERLLAEQA
jgi:hypothetical protein